MLARLFCIHKYGFLHNIYGDMIRDWGWNRSVWQCNKCKKLKPKKSYMVKTCESCKLYDDNTKQCLHASARYINSNDLRMNITRQQAAFMRNTSTLCGPQAYHHIAHQPDLF